MAIVPVAPFADWLIIDGIAAAAAAAAAANAIDEDDATRTTPLLVDVVVEVAVVVAALLEILVPIIDTPFDITPPADELFTGETIATEGVAAPVGLVPLFVGVRVAKISG